MAENRINSRTKGNRSERVAASLFAKWTKKSFARVPSSGGLQWKAAHAKGDITCTTEGHYFPFCLEIKNYKELNFQQLLLPHLKNVKILEFWAQCKRDAELANKIPMLMMRYNGLPKDFFFVMMKEEHHLHLKLTTKNVLCIENLGLIIFTSTELWGNDYKGIKLLAKTLKNKK